MAFIPPQTQLGNKVEFGTEEFKLWTRQAFSEDISCLMLEGDKVGAKFAAEHLLTNKVNINFNMFTAGMENGVSSQGQCAFIVTKKKWCCWKGNSKVTHDI